MNKLYVLVGLPASGKRLLLFIKAIAGYSENLKLLKS